jgi:hypothetical protein
MLGGFRGEKEAGLRGNSYRISSIDRHIYTMS